jgi:hypothetical protein
MNTSGNLEYNLCFCCIGSLLQCFADHMKVNRIIEIMNCDLRVWVLGAAS